MSNFTKKKLCHPIGISQSAHLWMTGIFTLLLLCLSGSKAKAADVPSTWKSVNFNDGIRYSQWVINSRISDFYGNQTQRGFNTYDASGNKISSSKGTQKFDYVPGLVAKAILEAYANYSTFDWSKPWFYSVMNYAKDNTYTLIAKEGATSFSGITLDNMNACKMYFPLMAADALSTDAKSKGETAIANVLTDMNKYNSMYVIGGSESGVASSTNETVKSMFGGWFHKPAYTDQMWCDGLYMGAALLAQIINYKNSTTNVDATNDWDLIAKQFTISWNQLYNSSKGLLYHAFTANPKDDASSAWSGISNTTGSEVYHSEAFWGRAMGWYFLALVDVLEQMPSDNKNRETLRGYLQNLASGLANYQDAETGCWYQVIDEKDNTLTGNYLESSCTCLFAAAYLKAVRLGLLSTDGKDYKTIGENAFKGAVNQFMKCDTFGPTGATVQLVHNCASAGLGGTANRSGSRDYYINGSDVGQTNTYTEGKVMGAFIMAATEYEKANPKSIRLSSDLAPSYSLTKGESIKVEALGEGTATYKWYDAKTAKEVAEATKASFTPEASGSYYCKITVTPTTSAKTRAASTETYDITTGVTEVTVEETSTDEETGSEGTSSNTIYSYTVSTSENAANTAYTATGGTATLGAANKVEANGFKSDGGIGSTKYIKVVLTNNTLQAGDVITIKAYSTSSNGGIYISTSSAANSSYVNAGTLANKNTAEYLTYTVTESDALKGLSTIYLFRNGATSNEGVSTYIQEITITRSGSSSSIGYTITYNLNGHGTAIDAVTNATELPTELPTPTATGYTFDGWYTNEALTNAATAGATISANTTLYAKWSINKYTVTASATNGSITIVDGDNNPVTSPAEVPYGTKLVFTATPTSGYQFSSWTVEGTTGTESSNTYTIDALNANTTVTANFTATSPDGEETKTHTLIHFTDKKPSDGCVTVSKTNGKDVSYSTSSSVTYNDETYTTSLKIESATILTLTLTSESVVSFVFSDNTAFKLNSEVCTPTDGIYTATLAAGTHTLTRNSTQANLFVIDIQPTGPSISISTQPKSAEYVTGGTATALSVGVTFSNASESDYTLSYQWYSNTENSTTGGTEVGTNATTYTPSTTADGTTYYYCVVTATKSDGTTLTATSDVATITVSAPYVEFTTQPQGAEYAKGATVTDLSVEATTNIGEISYQWYSNTTNSTTDGTSISGATSKTYTPSTSSVGTTYYYCVASATYNSETISATSDIVSVEVVGKLYSYKVTSSTPKPECNEARYITGETEEDILVKMTFGGWKWGTNDDKDDHSYVKPNSNTVITDAWKAPAKQAKVNALEGYEYAIAGTYDAVHEDKTATTYMYGNTRYGWFVSPKRENNITTESYPFTLPVRGTFMTFEPTMNGTLTIYLLQNGAWNSDDDNNIIPGQFRMHAFQITNQRGLVLEEFAPQYKITVNQKVMDGYTCSKYAIEDKPATTYAYDDEEVKNYKDIIYWKEFWDLSDVEREAVYTNWANGTNGSETIIKLENGSFLAIQKAIVKYQFHVTGNETYYMFSNFSKLGFAGATFYPDEAQPTDNFTFSNPSTTEDSDEDHSLSDDKAFTKIEHEEDGTIPGTSITNYKFKIDGKEVGKVDGVFIPQFQEINLWRTFKPNQWTTLCLPFNLTQDEVQSIFGEGTQIIMLNKATLNNGGARLEFIYHEIQNVLPGYPYLIKPTLKNLGDGAYTSDGFTVDEQGEVTGYLDGFLVNNKCINPFINQFEVDTDPYTFKGTPDYCTADVTKSGSTTKYSVNYGENDIFVSEGDGKLYVSGGSSYGKGYRAWLKKKGTGETTSVKSISVVMSSFSDDDNTTTSIDVAEMAPDLLEALGIQTGVYNLNGQRVANDTRNLKAGIYIVNGKKTVVR